MVAGPGCLCWRRRAFNRIGFARPRQCACCQLHRGAVEHVGAVICRLERRYFASCCGNSILGCPSATRIRTCNLNFVKAPVRCPSKDNPSSSHASNSAGKGVRSRATDRRLGVSDVGKETFSPPSAVFRPFSSCTGCTPRQHFPMLSDRLLSVEPHDRTSNRPGCRNIGK